MDFSCICNSGVGKRSISRSEGTRHSSLGCSSASSWETSPWLSEVQSQLQDQAGKDLEYEAPWSPRRTLSNGGNTSAPAESMVSAVWINKERRHSLSQDKVDPEAAGMLEEADSGYLQVPRSPWHTHLQMYCSVQTLHQDAGQQVKHQGMFPGSEQRLPQERDSGLLKSKQVTQQETTTPEAAQHEHQVDHPQTQTVGSGFHNGLQGPSSIKNPQRPGKPAHYPFPQRKAPRISQAARNLGLYGPP
ncbi:uncharacterized protein C9orf152 homolog [Myotis lucifugus]|uniref:uncharacterized protein C9orf152 homolog n=1 Tax=Myotis lucifugus TaxID=59463 RepID=UPI000CCC87E2|nr:uncharacterized protein C9orf152 homolog [Myotis lucifugus]